MLTRLLLSVVVAGAAVLALAPPARAGGWATITLDSVPAEAKAGEALSIGFMVRQHGVTPINALDAAGRHPIRPYLTARNRDGSDTVRADARQEGAVGHFVVDVTFPSAGAWDWSITPDPFEGTKFEPLKVVPAGLSAAAEGPADPAPATQARPEGAGGVDAGLIRWGALGVVVLGAGLILASRRRSLGRWIGARAR